MDELTVMTSPSSSSIYLRVASGCVEMVASYSGPETWNIPWCFGAPSSIESLPRVSGSVPLFDRRKLRIRNGGNIVDDFVI